jgi:diacylglycerol kinase (ATP)
MAAPFCVIYNPYAGRGGSAEKWNQVHTLLGSDAEYRPTSHAGHAVELARAATEEGFGTVVAAGGDGTVHEVINGMLQSDRRDVAFGLLPLGSGNDYARMINAPFEAAAMVMRLRSTETWAVDAGQVIVEGKSSRYFCNTSGMGIGGAVTWEASRIRWLRGVPLYGWASLKAIVKHFRSVSAKVTLDGETMQTGLLYAVAAIGRAEGGGFLVAPEAKLDDGWFNLMYVVKMGRLGAVFTLPRLVIPGLRGGCKAIQEKLVRELVIETDRPLPLHADGEVLATPQQGVRQVVMRLLPGRLLIRGTH